MEKDLARSDVQSAAHTMTAMDHAREVMRLWQRRPGEIYKSNRPAAIYAAQALGIETPTEKSVFRAENGDMLTEYPALALDLLHIKETNTGDPLGQLIALTKFFEERMGGQLS